MAEYILIIDDDRELCRLLSMLLERKGYETSQGYDGKTALQLLARREPHVLLLDAMIPEPNGMEVLSSVRILYPLLPVIMITGYAGVKDAVSAIKAGAFDYLPKPFDNSKVLELVERAIQFRGGKSNPKMSGKISERERIIGLMGPSLQTSELVDDLLRVARTDFSVIIQGETGTGKEMVAKNIHRASQRSSGPFIAVDCGAIPETLIDNELFGHEKGSYTGADYCQTGKFEAAEGGTLFLDEIGNMSLSAQSRLLRVLQEHVIYRVGGNKPIRTNVRVLAASNKNLLDEVANGSFREDLYYRLNEYTISIPPLRRRREDILPLAANFLRESCSELHKSVMGFSPLAKEVMLAYPWPGNIRELRTVVRRAALVSAGEIEVDELGLMLNPTAKSIQNEQRPCLQCMQEAVSMDGSSLKEIVQRNTAEIERMAIRQALKKTGNNKAEAARLLKIDYKTLFTKLKKMLPLEDEDAGE